MRKELEILKEKIVADYAEFIKQRVFYIPTSSLAANYDEDRVESFAEGIFFEEGRKYIKVVKHLGSQQMVWGFIVKSDNDKKFQKGDILKAASWAAPARNAARGNIISGDYGWVQWTGPAYL